MKKFIKQSVNKSFFIVLVISIIVFSCKETRNDQVNNVRYEQIVDSIYSNSFNSPIEFDVKPNPVSLYRVMEDYFIFIGALNTRDQEGYKKMCNEILERDIKIDLHCLYDYYPEIQLLSGGSNCAVIFYGFEISANKGRESLSKRSSILRAYESLQKMQDGFNINFDKRAFMEYIDSIDSSDFENKFIYRIPILAFLHIFLVEET